MNRYVALASVSHHRHWLGDDIYSTLINAAGELAKKGVTYAQDKDAAQKAEKSSSAALDAVIAADGVATDAAANALISADAKAPSAAADLLAAQQAAANQDATAAGLSVDNQKKRSDAAKDNLKKYTKLWQSVSDDPVKSKAAQFRVQAAQLTYGKTQNQQMVTQGQLPPGSPPPHEQSWLTKKVVGPVPGWGVLAGGAALLSTLGVVVVKMVR